MTAALGWGAFAASSLVIGAALGLARQWSNRLVGLVLAFGAGALISASVNRLVAAPTSDCERIDELVSPEESCPVVMSETTSACGKAGSERTIADGCESGPVKPTITR